MNFVDVISKIFNVSSVLARFVEGTAAEKARKVINKMLDYRL